LDPPAKDCHGLLLHEATDPVTGEILHGLNDRYIARSVKFWPPEQGSLRSPEDERLEDLYTLMNPPSHLGNVEVTGDDRSFVYATGGKDQPRAIIFVSFDPANNLGMRKWYEETENLSGGKYKDNSGRNQCHEDDIGGGEDKKQATRGQESFFDNNGETWIWRELAMYRVIDRGFNFGL
jgi:hypothetical protein